MMRIYRIASNFLLKMSKEETKNLLNLEFCKRRYYYQTF